jgi:hypothetical protein
MKKIFKKISLKDIAQAIIATLIVVYIIQPIIDMAKYYPRNIFSSLTDFFYYCAANSSGNETILFVALVVVQLVLSISIVKYDEKTKDYSNDIDYILRDIEANKRIMSVISENAENAGELKNKLDDIENKLLIEGLEKLNKEQSKNTKFLKIKNAFIIVYTILLLTLIPFTYVLMYIPSAYKNSFDIAITKITPYVESSVIDMLQSDWVRMKTKKDYIDISKRIELILEENNLD